MYWHLFCDNELVYYLCTVKDGRWPRSPSVFLSLNLTTKLGQILNPMPANYAIKCHMTMKTMILVRYMTSSGKGYSMTYDLSWSTYCLSMSALVILEMVSKGEIKITFIYLSYLYSKHDTFYYWILLNSSTGADHFMQMSEYLSFSSSIVCSNAVGAYNLICLHVLSENGFNGKRSDRVVIYDQLFWPCSVYGK